LRCGARIGVALQPGDLHRARRAARRRRAVADLRAAAGVLSTHSYTAEGGTLRGQLVIAEHMTMTAPRLGDRVLLVDDMVDSGHTLEAVDRELPQRFPHITDMRTAVVWYKGCSVFKPDYYVDYLPDSPWIHQPFEIYDTLRPEELKARLAAATGAER
jgi:hypoxanthine phosphoribosyltransferase